MLNLTTFIRNKRNTIVWFIVASFYFFSPIASADNKVIFCTEARPYPPYIYLNKNGKASGLLVDIIKRSSKLVNATPTFVSQPWLRCQKMVEQHKAHALFGMIKTAERELKFQFPANNNHFIATAEYPIFYAKSSAISEHLNNLFKDNQFSHSSYNEIKNFGLQAPLGYVVQDFLARNKIASNTGYTVDEGLKVASINRLDGYIVERNIGLARIKALGIDSKLKVSKNSVMMQNWYVPFNKTFYKKNTRLVEAFWTQVAKNRS